MYQITILLGHKLKLVQHDTTSYGMFLATLFLCYSSRWFFSFCFLSFPNFVPIHPANHVDEVTWRHLKVRHIVSASIKAQGGRETFVLTNKSCLTCVQLSREDEASAGAEETEVRREDQDKINRFSRLHQRETTLEEQLRAKQV
jgi:hypothetical protein